MAHLAQPSTWGARSVGLHIAHASHQNQYGRHLELSGKFVLIIKNDQNLFATNTVAQPSNWLLIRLFLNYCLIQRRLRKFSRLHIMILWKKNNNWGTAYTLMCTRTLSLLDATKKPIDNYRNKRFRQYLINTMYLKERRLPQS